MTEINPISNSNYIQSNQKNDIKTDERRQVSTDKNVSNPSYLSRLQSNVRESMRKCGTSITRCFGVEPKNRQPIAKVTENNTSASTDMSVDIDINTADPNKAYNHEQWTSIIAQADKRKANEKKKIDDIKQQLMNPTSDEAFVKAFDDAVNTIDHLVQGDQSELSDLIHTMNDSMKKRVNTGNQLVETKHIEALFEITNKLDEMVKQGSLKNFVNQDKANKRLEKFEVIWKTKKESPKFKNLSAADLQKEKNKAFQEFLVQYNIPKSSLQKPLLDMLHFSIGLFKTSRPNALKESSSTFINNIINDPSTGLSKLANTVRPDRYAEVSLKVVLKDLGDNAEGFTSFYTKVNSNEKVSPKDYKKLLDAFNKLKNNIEDFKRLTECSIPQALQEANNLHSGTIKHITNLFNMYQNITLDELKANVEKLINESNSASPGTTPDKIKQNDDSIRSLRMIHNYLSGNDTIDVKLLGRQLEQLAYPSPPITQSDFDRDLDAVKKQVGKIDEAIRDLGKHLDASIQNDEQANQEEEPPKAKPMNRLSEANLAALKNYALDAPSKDKSKGL